MKKPIMFLFLSALVAGCSFYNINSEEISENFYPSKESGTQVVYLEEINRPHEIIGYVTVNTERRQGMEEVIEKLKREAAVLGGDAITSIIKNPGKPNEEKITKLQKLFENAYIRTTFKATVVAFTDNKDTLIVP